MAIAASYCYNGFRMRSIMIRSNEYSAEPLEAMRWMKF
jgi:hypothetical protein